MAPPDRSASEDVFRSCHLRSLRDRYVYRGGIPVVALRLPPATVLDPSGIVAGRYVEPPQRRFKLLPAA